MKTPASIIFVMFLKLGNWMISQARTQFRVGIVRELFHGIADHRAWIDYCIGCISYGIDLNHEFGKDQRGDLYSGARGTMCSEDSRLTSQYLFVCSISSNDAVR